MSKKQTDIPKPAAIAITLTPEQAQFVINVLNGINPSGTPTEKATYWQSAGEIIDTLLEADQQPQPQPQPEKE